MNETLNSPPKLRRLVHLDKTLGIVSTSPLSSAIPDRGLKLPIPRLKIPESFCNVQSESTMLQPSPRRSTTPSPRLMGHLIQPTATPISLKGSIGMMGTPIADVEPTSSLSLESQIVDGAIDNVISLPQMVTDVSLVQKGQSNEISRHMLSLSQLEAQVQKEQKKNSEMLLDISSMTKKIYITEDLVTKKQKSCDNLEEEIEAMVMNNSAVEKFRYLKLKEIEKEKKVYNENKKKVHEYVKDFMLYEESLPLYKHYIEMKNTVKILQEKYNAIHDDKENSKYICSGKKLEDIKRKVKDLEEKQKDLEKTVQSKETQIDQINKQKDKVQQNITVLHKRNAAQLTRLKKQVKDQQYRQQQWLDQISHLNKIISDLQQQIDEC